MPTEGTRPRRVVASGTAPCLRPSLRAVVPGHMAATRSSTARVAKARLAALQAGRGRDGRKGRGAPHAPRCWLYLVPEPRVHHVAATRVGLDPALEIANLIKARFALCRARGRGGATRGGAYSGQMSMWAQLRWGAKFCARALTAGGARATCPATCRRRGAGTGTGTASDGRHAKARQKGVKRAAQWKVHWPSWRVTRLPARTWCCRIAWVNRPPCDRSGREDTACYRCVFTFLPSDESKTRRLEMRRCLKSEKEIKNRKLTKPNLFTFRLPTTYGKQFCLMKSIGK